ncbi:MAG: hypothetical protein KKG99_00730 [Bacteroidetes bacterium]|nr:hypothetical protein [Bacteroidota bacterium]
MALLKIESGTNNFGLGLALSKKISDYHQIEIQVESKLDYGSTFTLIFPKKKQTGIPVEGLLKV